MSAEVDLIGHQARSKEGRGLSVRSGDSDKWITIQKNTFMNWVNLQLQGSGYIVEDFERDFDDGVRLCALVESLQNRKIGKVIKKPMNQHQSLENVTLALKAIADDNVRLVNIGSEDVVNGNLKLILGLVWHLILRYQIGKTKFPPKKLMLAWLQAVIPECRINNFTSDWNDGVALSALIDYCQPGLYPGWKQLNRHSRLENCASAMQIAKDNLNIPIVVHPEDFASPHLDELSGMTYLSYYMMPDSPGYFATRREIRAILQQGTINNFTTDWNDGRLLCTLVKSVGGDIPGWPNLSNNNVENLQKGLEAARRLGIEPIFTAEEMADPEVEHLGVMAYAAYFTKMKPVKLKPLPKGSYDGNMNNVHIGKEKTFQIHVEEGSPSDFKATLKGPDSNPPVRLDWSGNTARCSFTPIETGQHKLDVLCEGKSISGCPVTFKVIADRSRVSFHPPSRCPVGVNSELKVDASGAGPGDVRMEARSPSGRTMNVPVMFRQGVYMANFAPNEVGKWDMSVLYDGEHISGSPYSVNVFDPSLVRVYGLEGGAVGKALTFNADASQAGEGDVKATVSYGGQVIPCYVKKDGSGEYKIDFTPQGSGLYKVNVFMNDMEVRGSPYTVEIVDSSMVTLSGDGLSFVPVDRPALFTVHTGGAGSGNVAIDIIAPNGQNVPIKLSGHGSPNLNVEYTPRDVGTYTVSAALAGRPIKGSPFKVKTYDPNKVKVSKISQGVVGVPTKFTVDASKAGEGTMEIAINSNGRNIPNQARPVGDGQYEVSFVGRQPLPHQAVITYNGQQVPGSPFHIDFLDASQMTASGDGLGLIPCRRHAEFLINTPAANLKDLTVDITGSDGHNVPARIRDRGDGTYKVEWTPNSVGNHRVQIEYAGVPIGGSPYSAQVFDASLVKVSPVNQGFIGKPVTFGLDAGDAGDGNLEIHVTADGESVPNFVRQERDANFRVTFTPQRPGRHKVNITFNGEPVPGSPFACSVVDTDSVSVSGDGVKLAPANQATFFRVDPKGAGDFDMRAWVVSPSGHDIPVRITGNPHSSYRVDYTPVDVGTHKVYVEYGGVEMRGSPFDVEIFDPALVRVNNPGKAYLNKPVYFYADTSIAGNGTVEAEVKSRGYSVPCQVREVGGGRSEITFSPHDISTHLVNLTFNGLPLPGGPYQVDVIDSSSVSVSGEGLQRAKVYRETWFNLDLHGMDASDLDVSIASPSGSRVPCGLSRKGHVCRVEFTPMEPGPHVIDVMFAGSRVQGSPFTCQAYDPSRVRITDVDRTAKKEREIGFTIDTSAAGLGDLEVGVTHHGHTIHTQRENLGDGRYRYTFFPGDTGHFEVNATFNDDAIPGSPLIINVEDDIPTFITISFRGVEPLNVRGDRKNYFMLHMDGKNIDTDLLDVNIEGYHMITAFKKLIKNDIGYIKKRYAVQCP